MLLAAGLALWVISGLLRGDVAVIAANAVGLSLLSCIIYFKLPERKAPHEAWREQRAA